MPELLSRHVCIWLWVVLLQIPQVTYCCGFCHRSSPLDGNATILTVVDRFSKAVHFIPLSKLPSSGYCVWSGIQFTSQVWKVFCSALGASVSHSPGYHPQTNGQADRTNQTLESALQCVTAQHTVHFSSFLPCLEYTQENLILAATGMSTFQLPLPKVMGLIPFKTFLCKLCMLIVFSEYSSSLPHYLMAENGVCVWVCVPVQGEQMQLSIFANKSYLNLLTKPITDWQIHDVEPQHGSLLTGDGGNIPYVKTNICSVTNCGITWCEQCWLQGYDDLCKLFITQKMFILKL